MAWQKHQLGRVVEIGQARGRWGSEAGKGKGSARGRAGEEGTVTTSTEDSPIYSKAISGWMATHQGRMPGVVPASGEPEDDLAVDTPYLDDAAKNGISPWGRNRAVMTPAAQPR
jgi:hypothetical protein